MSDVPVSVLRIDHVQLAMPPGEEDAAQCFYEGLLGIPRVPKPEALATRGGCWFEDGSLRVHLGVEQDFRPARKAHPALVVSDFEQMLDKLRRAGHEVRPGDMPGQAYVDDPFGNRVEIVAPPLPTPP